MGFAPTGSQYRTIPGNWVAAGTPVSASLTTALAGDNNDLKFTSTATGAAYASGNSVTVEYVVAGNDTALSVDVDGTDITVNVATDSGGAATSTATQVRDAVNGDAEASDLVIAAHAAGNDGSGVVAALAATSLSGGQDYVIGTTR